MKHPFLDNKYTSIYFTLIGKYSNTSEIYETHHIIPKSMKGINDDSNLVRLPLRLHLIVHKLLVKMTVGRDRDKMYFALFQMMNRKVSQFSSRDYERARSQVSRLMSSNNPMKRKDVISKRTGVKRPDQSVVASERNRLYWTDRGRPMRVFSCPACSAEIRTRVPERKTCNRVCREILKNGG